MRLIKKLSFEISDEFLYFGFLNLIFIGSFFIFHKSPFFSRWAPFLLIGFLGFTYLGLKGRIFNVLLHRHITLIYLIAICSIEIIAFNNLILGNYQFPFSNKIILFSCLISAIFFLKNKIGKSLISKIAFIFIPLFYVTNLANYNNFISILDRPIINYVLVLAVIKLIIVFDSSENLKPYRFFELMVYPLLLLLSFRSDPLFSIHGSEYHWSYYANVIATYQSGGILLWDTPSQYGFLNIILGSQFSNDPWQSFYLFQSFLLFFISSISFYTLNSLYRERKFGTLLCALVTLVFFFSDPALIGPQPFPSSSVIRFGPSFLLLIAMIWTLNSTNILGRYRNYLISIIFIIGCLWSAESLLYCLTIFLAFHFSKFLIAFRDREQGLYKKFALMAIFALALLAISYLTVFFVYRYIYQVTPDISMFFMYGKYYSQGFGSLPIKIYGFIWTILLPLLLLMSIFYFLYKKSIFNSQFIIIFTITGAIFSWFSYFVGRAVPNNIMVLSPMLIWCFLVTFYYLKDDIHSLLISSFKLCCYIFITLHIGSYLMQPQFFSLFSLQKFKSYTSDIALNREAISPSLLSLLSENNLLDKNLAYYGYSGTLPQFPKYHPTRKSALWLPQPFALLDEPIPSRISDRITSRYIAKHKMDGLIVLDIKNHNVQFFKEWLNRLSSYYSCHVNVENLDYRIYACTFSK